VSGLTHSTQAEAVPAAGTTDEPAGRTSAVTDRPVGARVLDFATKYAVIALLVGLVVAATFANPGFWNGANLKNILTQNAPVAIVSVGMTYVIIAGMFDLSVGAIFAAGAVVFADLTLRTGSLWLSAFVALVVGLAAGLVNAGVVTALRVNPFIATIGTGAAFGGGVLVYAHSNPIFVDHPGFQTLGLGDFHGIPWPVLIAAVVFAVGAFMLSRTVYGRHLHAVGGNREAARLAGLRVNLLHVSVFAIVGICSAAGGMIVASQLSVGQPTLGAAIALQSFAIVIIGGTSVYGGEGAMWRTLCGVLILSVLTNLFNALAWDAARQAVAEGTVLVGAVALDALRRRRT
jgi:ribose transport system permease protein